MTLVLNLACLAVLITLVWFAVRGEPGQDRSGDD
jgi:hypothetical protein